MFGLLKGIAVLTYVGVKSATNVCKGCVHTATDGARVLSSVCKGDYENAVDIVGKRIEKAVTASAMSLYSAGKVIEKAAGCIEDRSKVFWDRETINDLTMVTGAFVIGGTLSALPDDESCIDSDNYDAPLGLIPNNSHCLPYMNSYGFFVGDDNDLEKLIELGQIDNTEHIDSDDISRSEHEKSIFLKSNGFNSVPEGYEVHHIIPLSEGGADSHENMILVTTEQHDIITKAHSDFYGWHR